MKKFLLISAALVLSFAGMSQAKPDEVVKFNTEVHNFGKMKQNVPVTYNFEIKNISDKAVVVENVTAGCGCTIPEKPQQPIQPGATAKLKVQFTAPTLGQVQKEVVVKFAGIDEQKILRITGEVVAADQAQQNISPKAKPKPKK